MISFPETPLLSLQFPDSMGEIDTKSIESVQTALTMFEENCEQKTKLFSGSDLQKEVEGLVKDLATYKLQLEAKNSTYLQALLKLDHYQKTIDNLSTQLNICESHNHKYIVQCREATILRGHLESKINEMASQLTETSDHLSHVQIELKAAQEELKLQAEMMKLFALESEREKCVALAEKDAEIELVTAKANKARDQLEEARRQMETMHELDCEMLRESEEAVSEATNKWKQAEADMEVEQGKNSALEKEVESANEQVDQLIYENELLKSEVDGFKEREREAEVEMALLKSELHKGRAEIAAAEVRAESVKSGLYLAVQQLAIEAEQVKEENQRLREEANKDTCDDDIKVDDDHLKPEYKEMKKELEMAKGKVGELRSRAEQAVSRAEAAERAKAAVEDQLRKWREQRQRKKAALAALREESVPKKYDSPSSNHQTPPNHQPLIKILNMKF